MPSPNDRYVLLNELATQHTLSPIVGKTVSTGRLAMMWEWFHTVWTAPLGELTLLDVGLLAGLLYLLRGSIRLVEWMLADWQRWREFRKATRYDRE